MAGEVADILGSINFLLVLAAVGGVCWGILGGALPGISPSICIDLLVPFTYTLDPSIALVLLASSYIGAEYGGSVPAILIGIPGTNAAAATVIDGYAMQQQGAGRTALGISLYSGFVGSLVGLSALVLLSEPLSRVALQFSPPAYFALGVMGLSFVASLSGPSLVRGAVSVVLGLILSTVGTDPVSGVSRFTFGEAHLLQGIKPLVIMVGLFAVGELLMQATRRIRTPPRIGTSGLRLPAPAMMRRLLRPQLIGGAVGTVEGAIPGVGGSVASFLAYSIAHRSSSRPDEFGHGSPEGIASPETANSTVAVTALVPLLSLGIPGSNSAAILLGGFLIHGIRPGPMVFVHSGDIVANLYTGLFVAALALLVCGMIMLPVCAWLANRPRPLLQAMVLAIVVSGVYTIESSLFDLGLLLAAGILGYAMRLFQYPCLPLVVGLVLGYMVESNFRRSLVISDGDYGIFFSDPLSLGLLIAASGVVILTLVMRKKG